MAKKTVATLDREVAVITADVEGLKRELEGNGSEGIFDILKQKTDRSYCKLLHTQTVEKLAEHIAEDKRQKDWIRSLFLVALASSFASPAAVLLISHLLGG